MTKLSVTENGVTISIKQDEGRIDSRIIAQMLDIQHDNFIQTLEKHQNDIQAFGVFLFQTEKPLRGSKGGRPERFAMLNEDQFIFAVTLSRNTPKVVKAKAAIVKAFSAARRLINAQGDYLSAYHDLHDTVQNMEAVALKRGSSAPKGICHVWLEKLNNKLLGKETGQRHTLTRKEKQVLNTLCQIEQTAADGVLQAGGDEKEAYHEAKRVAKDFMQQFGRPMLYG